MNASAPAGRSGRIRSALVAAGVLVWIPYLVVVYGLGGNFPVGWVLAVHVPCMVTALVLRILDGRRRRRPPPDLS